MNSNQLKTKRGIAKKAGITSGFFSQILNGNARTSWDTAKELAEILDISPTVFMEKDLVAINVAVVNYLYGPQNKGGCHENHQDK